MEDALQKGCCPSSPRQPTRKPQVCPLVGHVTIKPRRQWVSSHPASLTFSAMCLSLLPQHGAQCFRTQHLLSRDSGPSGRTKLNRGFRKYSTHARTCTQVCTFLKVISKDGMCCLLRPDLPLRWSCWPAPLFVCPIVLLCTPASPTPSSQHPLCAPLFSSHMPAFLP